MGIIRMGVPKDLVVFLKGNYNINNFVETGTYLGDTALWASENFENAFTIEKSEIMFGKATNKHKNSKVNFIFGDTREKLQEVISKLKGGTIFWLDAHWSGSDTYGQNDECPIVDEIKIINSHSNSDFFIMIDDARLFLTPPPEPHHPDS